MRHRILFSLCVPGDEKGWKWLQQSIPGVLPGPGTQEGPCVSTPAVCWPWDRIWQRSIRSLGSYLPGVPRPTRKDLDLDDESRSDSHTISTKGTTRGDLTCTPGAPSLSVVGQQGSSKQQEQGRVWQVSLTHAKMQGFEIQGITNPFAPLLIWAFVPPNKTFCQPQTLLETQDSGLRSEHFLKSGPSYMSP